VTRAELVAAAGETIRKGSKSFHMASRLFDRPTRDRAWLLYCWCRHCDDQCDGQKLGERTEEAAGSAAEVEAHTRHVLAGGKVGQLPFDALAEVLTECAIPHRYLLDHLQGFALDAEGWRPQDEADLLRYCYHVAGAVGCMMAVVMGVSPDDEETLRRASDLGIAFQLSNIARDVRDDHEAGRCYLPAQWLHDYDIDSRDPLRPDQRERLVLLVQRLCSLADRYEASALKGVGALGFRSRWAILSAAGIYGRIGRRVSAMGLTAWDTRVVVPKREKGAIILASLGRAMLRAG
jgi:15-cis-phytoene synthase